MDEPRQILALNSLNEVLRGLTPTQTVRYLLQKRADIELLETACSNCRAFPGSNRRLLRECILVVLDELGADEFETRIGIEPNVARLLLRELADDAYPLGTGLR